MTYKVLTMTILATLLLSGEAFASLARMAVMGSQPVFSTQGTGSGSVTNAVNGSLWYDDDYNVFYNPSYVNDNRNYAVVQKGFEGGFYKSIFENFAYGIYVNRGGGNNGTISGAENQYSTGLVAPGLKVQSAMVNGTQNGTTFFGTQRPIDFFLGGDTGVKWGLHLAWAYNRDQSGATQPNNGSGEITARYWHLDFGFQLIGLEPYVGATFLSEYRNSIATAGAGATAGVGQVATEALHEFDFGFRYKYEGWTPYVSFKKYREGGSAVNNSNLTAITPAGSIQVQTAMTIYGGGLSHDTKVADGVHIYKNVGAWYAKAQDDGGQAEIYKNFSQWIVPINVAIEGEATSWLILRAGAWYDFINQKKFARTVASPAAGAADLGATDRAQSQAGAVLFRIGSTIKFGKLYVDSAFGTGAGAGTANLDGGNAGFDSQTFALLSASYHW